MRDIEWRIRSRDREGVPLPLRLPAEYWLDLRGHQPAQAARQLKQLMRILQGERDYQATMDGFKLCRAAPGDRKNVTFQSYPNLNHLFIEGEGKTTSAEYMKLFHVSGTIIDDIAAWVKQR